MWVQVAGCVRRERFHEKPERANPDPARESRILWPAGGRLRTDCKTRAPIIWPLSSTRWNHAAHGQSRSTDVLCLINKWARRLGNGNFNARNRLYSVLPQAKRWWSEPPTSLIANIPNSFLALGPYRHLLKTSFSSSPSLVPWPSQWNVSGDADRPSRA